MHLSNFAISKMNLSFSTGTKLHKTNAHHVDLVAGSDITHRNYSGSIMEERGKWIFLINYLLLCT